MKTLESSIFPKFHHISYTNHIINSTNLIPLSSSKKWAPAAHITAAADPKKVVVIMGPTGCGKTKLSIDLASKAFPSSEIINSDKIQVYKGLDITTNKVPFSERNNVPHHLLGEFESSESHPEFTPSDFRSSASQTISRIVSNGKLPFIAGGSNSFVYALLAKQFNPDSNVFGELNPDFCTELQYECCFLWVDVSFPVLNDYIFKRVDDMLELGMFEELCKYFEDFGPGPVEDFGLNKAIGVPEFERYFRGTASYDEAVREVKDNTWELVKRQVGKIRRLREEAGWEMNRVNTTGALKAKVAGVGRREAAEIWEREVLRPSVEVVKRFLARSPNGST
ncbi:hypothetical protein CASFOL_004099 [Castilleja foliolosa]|uniref:Adenylate isopentenyltransferase n=1 Tax=Castilleja foliolosa TaxID=1961234 RepID=A0ABD3EJ45_9LAMI